jgi:uncharacterized protein (DUF488 family)
LVIKTLTSVDCMEGVGGCRAATMRAMEAQRAMFTIGHSTHPIGRFLELLRRHGIEVLADVRRFPGSRRHPQFGAEALAGSLTDAGIDYASFGDELGGRRRADRDSANAGWRSGQFRGYADHMATDEFASGLATLESAAAARPAAIMCAEGDWRRCHRRLIADALVARGWRVLHIARDGRLERHEPTPFAVLDRDRVSYPGPQTLLD